MKALRMHVTGGVGRMELFRVKFWVLSDFFWLLKYFLKLKDCYSSGVKFMCKVHKYHGTL